MEVGSKHLFPPLELDGRNYDEWAENCFSHLEEQSLEHVLRAPTDEEEEPTNDTMAKARNIIKRHLVPKLCAEFCSRYDPKTLWETLKGRFRRIASSKRPLAMYDWNALRFQDFKSVVEYNSALYSIVNRMRSCGLEDFVTEQAIIDKTLSTFDPAYYALTEQYHRAGYTEYKDLLQTLITAEERRELQLRNHLSREPGRTPAPHQPQLEANHTNAPSGRPHRENSNGYRPFKRFNTGRGGFRGMRGGSRGRGGSSSGRDGTWRPTRDYQWAQSGKCLRCGITGHWAADCRTHPFHVECYQKMILKEEMSHNAEVDYQHHPTSTDTTATPSELINIDFAGSDIESNAINASFDLDDPSTCIVDTGSTNVILKSTEYFAQLAREAVPIKTIFGNGFAQGRGRAVVCLPGGTEIFISDAIYAPHSPRNLLSLKAINECGYGIGQSRDADGFYLFLQPIHPNHRMRTSEKIRLSPNGLPLTRISPVIEINSLSEFKAQSIAKLWHARLGHPGRDLFRAMIQSTRGIPIDPKDATSIGPCQPCAIGKLSIVKGKTNSPPETLSFLSRLHSDVCGPIDPPSGLFRYFMVVKDASSRYIDVNLLSSKNQVFVSLLRTLIRLRVAHPQYTIQTIRVDGAAEYTSSKFQEYCAATGIELQVSAPHAHNQNGAAEAAIKQIQIITRTILFQCNLPSSAWAYAVLHAAELLKIRPVSRTNVSPSQSLTGHPPTVAHLRSFGCAVYIPIPPPKVSKLGPRRMLGIYIGYTSTAKIRYLEPEDGQVFEARFQDCVFDESLYPRMGQGDNC